jgi:hypothetical protein
MRPLEFATALFTRRMTDCFIDVEFVESPLNKGPETVSLSEPLHAETAGRLIEAVENLAKQIAHVAKRKRCKIRCTKLTLSSSELKLTVFEFQGIE